VTGGSVTYAYGVLPAEAQVQLPPGVDGAEVLTFDVGGLLVLASVLDASRFGAGAWSEHSEDVTWLERVVTEHHGVLQAAIEQADVVPLRLPALHHDSEELRAALRHQERGLLTALERVAGRVELGVKAYATPVATEAATPLVASGRAYLEHRARQPAREEAAFARTSEAVAELHEVLTAKADAAVLHPPQDRALTGRSDRQLMNASYLVARQGVSGFRAELGAMADQALADLDIECTGPWPAYSFVGELTASETASP
jgi:hypothetical protein